MSEEQGITVKKEQDFSKWYTQVMALAEIVDIRFDVKGANVWMNYGYETMLNIKNLWDTLFKKNGIKEMYFPLIVPVKYCEQNPDWWKGFKEQAFWVRSFNEKEAVHIMRPTGEPAMYPMFSLWIRSHRDLPFRIYETVSSFRYETKQTRALIRDREITLWHEIHTAHATKEDAEKESNLHEKMYDEIWKKCALFPLKVRKPKWEIFPGAVGAIEYYNLMEKGRVMENGSINNLGQAYSKKFNIKFIDKDMSEQYVWQMCTGNGARLLAAIISVHGDDKGLVIPPEIAPIQVVIVPIYTDKNKTKVLKKADEIYKSLGLKAALDDREDVTPGWKYNNWELKGVPIRIEIGEKEMQGKYLTVVRRDTREKIKIKETDIKKSLKSHLDDIQDSLLRKSSQSMVNAILFVKNRQEIKNAIEKEKVAKIYWCGSEKCWDEIKTIKEGIELFGTDLKKAKNDKCAICGEITETIGYIANTY
jgi:prolyl-tRNA synthetase